MTSAAKANRNAGIVDRLEAENARLRAALNASVGYLTNALIDLKTGAPKRTAIMTIEGGVKVASAALAPSPTGERPNG